MNNAWCSVAFTFLHSHSVVPPLCHHAGVLRCGSLQMDVIVLDADPVVALPALSTSTVVDATDAVIDAPSAPMPVPSPTTAVSSVAVSPVAVVVVTTTSAGGSAEGSKKRKSPADVTAGKGNAATATVGSASPPAKKVSSKKVNLSPGSKATLVRVSW